LNSRRAALSARFDNSGGRTRPRDRRRSRCRLPRSAYAAPSRAVQPARYGRMSAHCSLV